MATVLRGYPHPSGGTSAEDGGVSEEQQRAPYLEQWLAYLDERAIPSTTPGHEQGRRAPPEFVAAFGDRALALDIPHDGGTFDVHLEHDPLVAADRSAAASWGARDAVFLVDESTTGNLAALSTLDQPGRPIAVTRAMHESLLAGLVLSGAQPVSVVPAVHPEFGILLDLPPEAVAQALAAWPDATAVALSARRLPG